jgi:hypothetical protein
MDMREAMEYVGSEGLRLLAVGSNRSTVVMSTVLENGDVARMTINVELLENPQIAAQRAQQERMQQQQQPPRPQQQTPPPNYPQQR